MTLERKEHTHSIKIKDVTQNRPYLRCFVPDLHLVYLAQPFIERKLKRIQQLIKDPDHHKSHLYNFDPLKPHFYIVKLGFTGVYIIFLIFAKNIDCGYSLEPPRRSGSNEYPQSMF